MVSELFQILSLQCLRRSKSHFQIIKRYEKQPQTYIYPVPHRSGCGVRLFGGHEVYRLVGLGAKSGGISHCFQSRMAYGFEGCDGSGVLRAGTHHGAYACVQCSSEADLDSRSDIYGRFYAADAGHGYLEPAGRLRLFRRGVENEQLELIL